MMKKVIRTCFIGLSLALVALAPGCVPEGHDLTAFDAISFGVTTSTTEGLARSDASGRAANPGLPADSWVVELGSDQASDIAYQLLPETKTSYSGLDQNGNLISSSSSLERIDWVDGDQVTVLSYQAHVADISTTPRGLKKSHGTYSKMDYDVVGLGTPSAGKHSARLSPSDGDGLMWSNANSNETHYFLAVYPAAIDKIEPYSTNQATFTAEIPQNQSPAGQRTTTENGRQVLELLPDMNLVYMYAGATGTRGSDISLQFKPMVSAIRFTVKAADVGGGTLKMTKATLSSTGSNLSGKVSARINYNSSVGSLSYSETGRSVSLTTGGVQLGDRDIRMTFITIGNAMSNLTLTLEFEGGITRSLQLKRSNSFISVSQHHKAYFDLAGISYMPTYDLPDAIWLWTEDVLPAPAPQNVRDGDGNPVTNPGVSYYFKDGSDAVATVQGSGSGSEIACGTSAGKRVLVARVTVGPVTAEKEIPVYVQKLDRVEIDNSAEHNVRVGKDYALPYTVYWSRPKADGTLSEMSETDATKIYNATATDLAGFSPAVTIPAASQAHVTASATAGAIKGVLAVASPGVPVSLSITDGSTKATHSVSDDTNVFVTDPAFTGASVYLKYGGYGTKMWAGDGQVGRIYAVRANYEDGSYDILDNDELTWTPNNFITADGFVTVPNAQGYQSATANFTDRYGVSRTVSSSPYIYRLSLRFTRDGGGAVNVSTHSGGWSTTFYLWISDGTDQWRDPYLNNALNNNWQISHSKRGSGSDDYITYTGAGTWDNHHIYYIWAYQYKEPPHMVAGYTWQQGWVSATASRYYIPYAEPGYQNHGNVNSPSATAYLSVTG